MTTSFAPVTIGEQAEELIRTLPGVVSVRVVGGDDNSVREVHILTTSEVSAKQTVRNVESALFAHMGLRIDHRRVSVAAATEAPPARAPLHRSVTELDDEEYSSVRSARSASSASAGGYAVGGVGRGRSAPMPGATPQQPAESWAGRRRLYFEDVEVRGSRSKGVACRVTLAKDNSSYIGEARGVDGDRARLELSARAACLAIGDADGRDRQFGLEGVRIFEAFDRKFVFVGVTVRYGREVRLLSGTCEIIDSAETSAVLAVLDATNRWIEYGV